MNNGPLAHGPSGAQHQALLLAGSAAEPRGFVVGVRGGRVEGFIAIAPCVLGRDTSSRGWRRSSVSVLGTGTLLARVAQRLVVGFAQGDPEGNAQGDPR